MLNRAARVPSPTWPLRVVAALTAGYAIAMAARPRLLARPCGMLADDGTVPPDVAAVTRSMGTRDAAMALALLAAPVGPPMYALTAARVICDAADVAYFGAIVSREQRRKVAVFCGGWALLELGVQIVAGGASVGAARPGNRARGSSGAGAADRTRPTSR